MAKFALLCVVLLFSFLAVSNAATTQERQGKLLNFMRFGIKCAGCPANYCDDDPAIIHGYCCGCARFYDSLPVKCSSSLRCPLNTYELCDKYEYMMACCCGRKSG